MDFMTILSNIWNAVAPYLAGVSVSGLISAIIYGYLRGAFNKTISKLDVGKIAEEATEKSVDKIKQVAFKQSIQPLVESELKKIDENAAKEFKAELAEVKASYEKLRVCLEKLSAYFDNSIGVSETAKTELHQALEDAKLPEETAESVVVEVVDEKDTKDAKKGKKTAETAKNETSDTSVVR